MYEGQPEENSIAAAFGQKKVTYDNGETSTIIAIAVRGGGYDDEWAGIFAISGIDDDHDGFTIAAGQVKIALISYIKDQGITGNMKIWIVGYSRAAATANFVAAWLDDGSISGGSQFTLNREDIYAYTFATPQNTKNSAVTAQKYQNIFNIVNPIDAFPKVAMSDWVTRATATFCTIPDQSDSTYKTTKAPCLSIQCHFRSPLYCASIPAQGARSWILQCLSRRNFKK
jgi:hypothetical protein